MFLSALGALGGALTFGIFLVLGSFRFVFVYVLAPETKGRQLGGDPAVLVQRRPLAG